MRRVYSRKAFGVGSKVFLFVISLLDKTKIKCYYDDIKKISQVYLEIRRSI